ncbi:hypothetical protein CANARDRAFT_25978 [[Candida] arabinofermentans NRRL YB-2248]|uniref:Protein BCP1 n=1 Tax=[Candida] arabinofermentans NRRL YB-2248 TaxID=983967 RepID=A0A1E4T7R7_9ASCO|nr:hypothetical protein CANARDRAFT_25978 [[Candida] arabinofermentans NRRL YB-2248]
MSKRTKKQVEEEEVDSDIDVSSTDDEELQEEDQEEEQETVDVDFDFFNLDPEVDFHATKNFLRQLFGEDSSFLQLSDLSDFILKENHVGTTIKTDGNSSDPFSLLSVINITKNTSNKAVKSLVDYLIEKSSSKTQLNVLLRQVLASNSKFRTGLIISERLINMPVETVPPMYRMLLEEMENSENADEEYNFDYFLIPSRVYKIVTSTIDQEMEDEDEKRSKKRSKKSGNQADEYDYFHYEDEVLESNSLHYGYFDFTNKSGEADARRVFNDYGFEPMLNLMLITKKALVKAANEMAEKFPPY